MPDLWHGIGCGPLHGRAAEQPASHLELSDHARQMARVETAELAPRALSKELRTVGRIEVDETNVAYITARTAGRVDEVYANFPGTIVRKDDHLVSIYSPDLLTTQSELLEALRRERTGSGTALAESARRRLELLGITGAQIDELIRTGQPQVHLVIYAPFGGTVIAKTIRPGQYVETGDTLFELADLSVVWLILEVYESEVAWVRFGQPVEVRLESLPSQPFKGTVAFIEPVLNEATRTIRVRVVLPNPEGRFRPGMYAEAVLQVPIMPDGTPGPTGLEGRYTCPMHPFVVADAPGRCTVCGMSLESVPGELRPVDSPQPRVLAVPYGAVLTTGERQLVYVEDAPGRYRPTEPRLGPRAGDFFPVLAGLEPGQRVVVRGAFLLDSQFQIAGNPSLLYPEGIAGGGVGHAGHSATSQPLPRGAAPGHSGREQHAVPPAASPQTAPPAHQH